MRAHFCRQQSLAGLIMRAHRAFRGESRTRNSPRTTRCWSAATKSCAVRARAFVNHLQAAECSSQTARSLARWPPARVAPLNLSSRRFSGASKLKNASQQICNARLRCAAREHIARREFAFCLEANGSGASRERTITERASRRIGAVVSCILMPWQSLGLVASARRRHWRPVPLTNRLLSAHCRRLRKRAGDVRGG